VTSALQLPHGYAASSRGGLTLVAAVPYVDDIRQSGLDEPGGWQRHLTGSAGPTGRGTTARVELPSGRVARIKALRRGGWTAALWRDRFVGTRRALDNLRLAAEAGRRGVATPAPLALLLARGRTGLVRAWIAVDEIEGARDLRACVATEGTPRTVAFEAAARLVRRMHDRGVEHRDLNLGNLLIRADREPAAYVVDLDRGRLRAGPLEFRRRQRALRRLERSYVKCCHPGPACEDVRRTIYTAYAGGDRDLARRLERGRRAGRAWIGLHRLGWRR
jgi:3-deoxy-D-manno-octulosonic acid kinase